MSYSDDEKPNPFRSRGFVFGAAILGLIVVAAIIAVIVGSFSSRAPDPTPSTTSPTAPEPTGEASICGLDTVIMNGTVDEAPKTDWSFIGRVAIPSSKSGAGPGQINDNGFRFCFERTPEGALFAAANLFALTADRSTLEEVASELIVPGTQRDELIREAPKVIAQPAPAISMDIAGFRILTYNGTSASVDLAIKTSTGELVSLIYKLEWGAGDWKWIPDDIGSGGSTVLLDSLGGYTPWGGGL